MNWNQEFIEAFRNKETLSGTDERNTIHKGYWIILKCQRFRFCFQVLWEVLTIFVYVPASDIIKTMLLGVNDKWNLLSQEDQICVIAALRHFDKKGDVSVIFNRRESHQ